MLYNWVKETVLYFRRAKYTNCVTSSWWVKIEISNTNSLRKPPAGSLACRISASPETELLLYEDMQATKYHCTCGPESTFESRHLKVPGLCHYHHRCNTEANLISLKKKSTQREVGLTWSLASKGSAGKLLKRPKYLPDPAWIHRVKLHVMKPAKYLTMPELC